MNIDTLGLVSAAWLLRHPSKAAVSPYYYCRGLLFILGFFCFFELAQGMLVLKQNREAVRVKLETYLLKEDAMSTYSLGFAKNELPESRLIKIGDVELFENDHFKRFSFYFFLSISAVIVTGYEVSLQFVFHKNFSDNPYGFETAYWKHVDLDAMFRPLVDMAYNATNAPLEPYV